MKVDCANGLDTKFNDDILVAQQQQHLSSELMNFNWLKEALSPEGNKSEKEHNDKQKQDENQKSSANSTPAKDEPHEYLELASQIFFFLDSKLGDAENRFLIKYVRNGSMISSMDLHGISFCARLIKLNIHCSSIHLSAFLT